MIELKINTKYQADAVYAGSNENGAYMCVVVKERGGFGKIKVWAENPTVTVKEGDSFCIGYITGVKLTHRLAQNGSGKWYDEYSVSAHIITEPNKEDNENG